MSLGLKMPKMCHYARQRSTAGQHRIQPEHIHRRQVDPLQTDGAPMGAYPDTGVLKSTGALPAAPAPVIAIVLLWKKT